MTQELQSHLPKKSGNLSKGMIEYAYAHIYSKNAERTLVFINRKTEKPNKQTVIYSCSKSSLRNTME